MRKNQKESTTKSLEKKKGKNLADQLQGGRTDGLVIDKKMQNLASKNPLEFIDAVLAHDPTKN